MKNPPEIQNKNPDYFYVPAITTVAMPLLFGRRKNLQTIAESPQEKPLKPKEKPKALKIAKYEVSDNKVKFFAAKGFPKKRWMLIKQVPLNEVTSVESFGNELSLTWNGAVYSFVFQKKNESFVALRDQIQGLLGEQQKTVDNSNELASQRKSDLTAVINSSIGIVDLSFDILMGLHEKRVNWVRLESYADTLGDSVNFTGQTLAPLNLEFAKVSAAIKRQVPKETSKEAYNILKSIYGYFEGLKPDDDHKDASLNFENAKAVILAYFTLNDLLFGKVIGEKDNQKESLALEGVLLGLANESNVKVNVEELKVRLDRLDVDVEIGSVVDDTRAIFKEQLKQL